jgi:hypothetical protein
MKNSGMMNPPFQPDAMVTVVPSSLAATAIANAPAVSRRSSRPASCFSPKEAEGEAAEYVPCGPWNGPEQTADRPDRDREDRRTQRADNTHAHGGEQIDGVEGPDLWERPDRLDAGSTQAQIHGVPAEGTEDSGQQCLVVLQAATVKDLEGEQRRSERRAEQDRERGGHPGDREYAHVGQGSV